MASDGLRLIAMQEIQSEPAVCVTLWTAVRVEGRREGRWGGGYGRVGGIYTTNIDTLFPQCCWTESSVSMLAPSQPGIIYEGMPLWA